MRYALGFLLIILGAQPALAIELPLQANVRVGGEQVLLSDLLTPGDAARLAEISGPIRLFRAPEPGMTRKVSRQTLARLVARQVQPEQLRLTGAGSITIERQGVWIAPEEMEAVLQSYLERSAAQLPGVSLSFKTLRLPPRFMVAPGRIEHQVIPSTPEVVGSRHLTLITRVDGKVVKNQTIRVALDAQAEVLVASADLRRGDRLGENNLILQQREISRLDEPFFRLDAVEGKQLKQMIRNGQPLLRRQVDFPPLIKRGDRVTIQLSNRGMLLNASGEARQNGELGETIRVRNSSSQREILCRVAAAGLVRVEM